MLVMALSLAAGEMAAQRPRSRAGAWMDAGIGYGRLRLTCQDCPPLGISGRAVTVTLGGAPSRYVLLGVEAQVWTGSDDDLDEQVRSINVVAQYYPWGRSNGFFLRGGTGLVDGRVAPLDTTAVRARARGRGIGISISAGYDLAITPRLALTFQAGDQIAALGDLVLPSGSADDTIGYVSRLSVALTLR